MVGERRLHSNDVHGCVSLSLFLTGIFKNNQAQVDEYMTALHPLLRRTTEGSVSLHGKR